MKEVAWFLGILLVVGVVTGVSVVLIMALAEYMGVN